MSIFATTIVVEKINMADGFALDIDDARVIATFNALPGRVRNALLVRCSVLSLLLEAKIKGKLSGDVLNVQTGALRRSIHSIVFVDGNVVHAEAASSADVPYAAIHEFGFIGVEHVREHVRTITSVFGHSLKDPILATVHPFDRQMNMPARSFMRSSLAEMSDDIVRGLQDAVNEAVAR